MGSYISICNNTSDTYYVKVGPDLAAVRVALIIASPMVGILNALLMSLVAHGGEKVIPLSTSSLIATTTAASAASGMAIPATLSGWSTSVAFFLVKALKDQGYVEIPPGGTHQFGKYSLSLWEQAACRRVWINPGEVSTDVVYMRPIFSGATANSTREHDIQYWINQHGHEECGVLRANLQT
ncbi:hypothetical protein L7F22_056814 [Adiantum nelumboides]|nr:hypothetical protein [Adiantum nelumboides]